jgi:hypothetical protein
VARPPNCQSSKTPLQVGPVRAAAQALFDILLPLLTPTRADVEDVARRTAAGIEKLLRATGRTFEPEVDDAPPAELTRDEPGLAACYAAAAQGVSVSGERAGLPTLRLVFPPEPPPRGADTGPLADEPVAEVRGINVHAKQVVDGRDRRQLERLCRYITRPPVAQERLKRLADGRLELRPQARLEGRYPRSRPRPGVDGVQLAGRSPRRTTVPSNARERAKRAVSPKTRWSG